MRTNKKKTKKVNAVENYKKIDRLIGLTSSISIEEKADLALKNVFAMLANIEIVNN